MLSINLSNLCKLGSLHSWYVKMIIINYTIYNYSDVILVVSASTEGQLYCTEDMNLIKSITDPTIFCKISGTYT